MADINSDEQAEAVRRLKAEIEELTKSSERLRLGFEKYRPNTFTENLEKGIHGGIKKVFSDGARRAEEEAVKQAKARGATEDQALAARLKQRQENEAGFAKATYHAMGALNGLGRTAGAVGGFARSMGEAKTGFDTLNPIIDAAAAAFSTIPFFGGAVKAAAEGAKFMLGQLQSATDAFQDISKIGGLTVTGMSGLQQQFLTSGMQLKSYTKTVTENSAALANFGGNVGKGARRFSDTAGMVQRDFGISLQRLGFGIDEIGEYTASYISRQTTLGLSQNRTNAQLAAGAAGYSKELDLLSKLTGESRKQLEKQQEAALSEGRFRAQYDTMVANGQEKQAKAMLDFQSIVNKAAPELAQGFRDVSTGNITSEASRKLFNTTQGAGLDIMKRVQSGEIDQVQAFKELQGALKANMGTLRSHSLAVGNDSGIFADYGQTSKLVNAQISSLGEVVVDQTTQMAGRDALTNDTVDAQRSMQQLSIQMQNLGFTLMPDAAKAVSSFTGALNKLLGMLSDRLGVRKISVSGGAVIPEDAPAVSNGSLSEEQASLGNTAGGAATARPVRPATGARAQMLERQKAGTPAGTAAPIDSGPVFSSANKVQVTLIEIRDEIKKLVRMGGVSGGVAASGQAQVQAALVEHDHAHPHPPSADVSPELAAKIGKLVNPLEKMSVTSGMMRNDGKTYHGAVDLAGKIGDKVMAPISGLAKVLSDPKGYGNYVEVTDTITGVKHILAHLDKTMIKTGDMVKAGQQVGTVGNTGRSTGAHLHHEIKLPDGTRVDARKFYAGAAGRGAAPGGTLGSLSQKYESGTAGSMAVGRDRSGGTSYGKYQIASKVGSMDAFLKLLQKNDPEAYSRLMAAGPQDAGTEGKFAQEWKKLAGEGRVQKSEKEFAVDKIFQPAMKGLKDQDLSRLVSGNKGLQEMMFSMAIQHGGAGAPAILNKVFKKGMTAEQLTEAAYTERGADEGKRYFGKSTEGERAGVVSRFGREKQDVLAMLGNPNMAGPSSVPTPVAAAPGTTAALPAAPATTATPQPAQPSTVAQQNSLMLQQLVTLNQQQNTLLGKILQTSQA